MKNTEEFLFACSVRVLKTLCGTEILLHPSSQANLQLVLSERNSRTTGTAICYFCTDMHESFLKEKCGLE